MGIVCETMQSKNSFSLDLRDNLELKKLFTGRKVGDRVTLETDFQVGELSDELLTGTIIGVAPIGGDMENPAAPSVPEGAMGSMMDKSMPPDDDGDESITPVDAVVIRKPRA